MPPSLAATSVGSLVRCQSTNLAMRAFSSSSAARAIGPENPAFIEIPQPPQRYQRTHKDIKGVLPAPRNLFPVRAGNKTSKKYLQAITPEPQPGNTVADAPNEYSAWKRRMAEARRNNLREGLVALRERKYVQDNRVAQISAAKSKDRNKRCYAPQRESDRLTNPTVTKAMRTFQHGQLPDPERAARVAEMAARVEARTKALEEKRRDALHTLYMHARNFITTEAQLDAEVEKIFTDKPFAHIVGAENKNSIWDAEGAPPTLQEMLAEVTGTQKTAADYYRLPAKTTGRRMVRVAEELTGGTMD